MGNTKNLINTEAIEKIKELAESKVCHFLTAIKEVPIITRPMTTLKVDTEGCLWFMSKKSSEKNEEIKADNRVQLLYSNHTSSEYLSIFGRAEVSFDQKIINELWNPIARAWFTEGKDDPAISLLKITPEEGYYWDTKNNIVSTLAKLATAAATGKKEDIGEHGKLDV